MKSLRYGKFKHSYLDEVNLILHEIWLPSTQEMEEEDWKDELLLQAEMIRAHAIKKLMLNALNLNYTVALEEQNWVLENIFSQWTLAGIEKVAIIVSKELITQISIELAFDEEASVSYMTQYFETEKAAQEWLLGNEEKKIQKSQNS